MEKHHADFERIKVELQLSSASKRGDVSNQNVSEASDATPQGNVRPVVPSAVSSDDSAAWPGARPTELDVRRPACYPTRSVA